MAAKRRASGRRGSRRDGDLVAQAREAFVAAQNVHHVEEPRRCRAAGEGGPQGLGDLAELDARCLGCGAHGRFRALGCPRGQRFKLLESVRQAVPSRGCVATQSRSCAVMAGAVGPARPPAIAACDASSRLARSLGLGSINALAPAGLPAANSISADNRRAILAAAGSPETRVLRRAANDRAALVSFNSLADKAAE